MNYDSNKANLKMAGLPTSSLASTQLNNKIATPSTLTNGIQTKGQGMSSYLSSNMSNITGAATGLTGATSNFSEAMNSDNSTAKTAGMADAGVDAVASAASAFGPVGMAVGAALKLTNSIGGGLMGKMKFTENKNLASGFGGVSKNNSDVAFGTEAYNKAGLAGKLFSSSSQKRKIAEANNQSTIAASITDTSNKQIGASQISQGMFGIGLSNKLNGNSYTDPNKQVVTGKKGLKIKPINKFEMGGIVKNIIISGALHARKHNLHELDEFKEAKMTTKGVPVISRENGGEIIQQAEFEKNEILFTKEVTDKLTDLFNKNTEESQIEAGKLLAYEITKNTIDSKDKIIKMA